MARGKAAAAPAASSVAADPPQEPVVPATVQADATGAEEQTTQATGASGGASGADSASQDSNAPAAAPVAIRRTSARQVGQEAEAPGPDALSQRRTRAVGAAADTTTEGALSALAAAAAADSDNNAGKGPDEESKDEDEDDDEDDTVTPGAQGTPAAPGQNTRANQDHPSGVWKTKSPTGIVLGEEYCKRFDHSKETVAWVKKVFNTLTDYPAQPHAHGFYPSPHDKPRFYENTSRSICSVFRIATIMVEVQYTDPNKRLMPTQQELDKTKFAGTLCSALDLVWFTKEDREQFGLNKYNDWAGSIEQLEVPAHGEHKYICDIVAGYYAKYDKHPTKKFAILYPFRPFKSVDGEPEIAVMEIDQEENFVKGAKVIHMKAENIIEIGGGCNSLCGKVNKWLKEHMGVYYAGLDKPDANADNKEVDPGRAVERMLGILDVHELRKEHLEAMKTYCDGLQEDEKRANKLFGIRKGRMDWNMITKRSANLEKKPHETVKNSIAVSKETTEYDKWFVKQLIRSCNIINTICEFGDKEMRRSQVKCSLKMMDDLQEFLTIHEEEILKHLTEEVDFDNPKEALAYSLFGADHHKMIDGNIRRPAHVPTMYSYELFLWLVAAIKSTDSTAYQDESTVWTSRRARDLYQHLKGHLNNIAKPQWLLDAEEEITQRKIAEGNKGGPAPDEPSGDDNEDKEDTEEDDDEGELKGNKPKKIDKGKPWNPMNRQVDERPPRGWEDNRSEDFDGTANKDRKVGVMAVFMNANGTRKNTHFWCVCDNAPQGHWVNTQGNHEASQTHPNALKKGFAVSSPNKKYCKPAKSGKPGGKKPRGSSAGASSTGQTVAEADLRKAKANIAALHEQLADVVAVRDNLHLQLHKAMALGNDHLNTAAQTANEMAAAHAKALRKKDEKLNDAITKMEQMRSHAHGFAELMLSLAPKDKAPDEFTCWNSFSGLLEDAAISTAFGDKEHRPASSSSRNVYNISKFEQATGSESMASPASHVAFQLTIAKVKAMDLPMEYEELPAVEPTKVAYKGKGKAPAKAPAKKRKREEIAKEDDEESLMEICDDDLFASSDNDEESE